MAQQLLEIKRTWKKYNASVVNGFWTVTTDMVASDEVMVIDFIALQSNPYVPSICQLFHNGTDFVCQANDGGLDSFEGSIEVLGGDYLALIWSGITGAAVLSARIHFTLFQVKTMSIDTSLSGWRGVR